VSGYQVGEWAAVVELRQAREIASVNESTNTLYLARAFTDRDGNKVAPTAGNEQIPGCPTYDAMAKSVVDYFLALKPGPKGNHYADAGEDAIRQNPEVVSVTQISPAGDVFAQADVIKIEALRLGELRLTAP
jgi:hypothetical protein